MERGRKRAVSILTCGALLACGVQFLDDAYVVQISILLGINIVLASSINLLVGYTGQICLAQAAFYGIGAYVSAIATVRLSLPFFIALPLSFMVAAVCGALLGIPTLRLKGHYLAIATMGFGIIVYVVLNNWDAVTQGPMGIMGIESPEFLGMRIMDDNTYLSFLIIVIAIVLTFIATLLQSAYGRAFAAIKTDEISAEVSGINTYYYKIFVFAISSGIAGLAGSLYAHYVHFISPESFSVTTSIEILILAIVGGLGTIIGPIIGSSVLMLLSELLRGTQELQLIIYGAMLVFVIIFLPQGIYPSLEKCFQRQYVSINRVDDVSTYLRPSISRGFKSLFTFRKRGE